MQRIFTGNLSVGLPVAALVLFSLSAKAAPTGTLAVDSCAGQVTVSATTIDFEAGPGFPSQCVQAGSTSGITSTFGNINPGLIGTISDLTGALPVGGVVFLSFNPAGGTGDLLDFILTSVGPGSSNTDCSIASDTQTCSILLGPGNISPIILSGSAAFGTTAILNMAGTVTDASGTSSWTGKFSANVAGSPQQVENEFKQLGQISSTYSGDLRLLVPTPQNPIPEPGTMALLGSGLLSLGLFARRRSRRGAPKS